MVMCVEVISRETIKPSSPTPHHLCRYKLSFLDQINPPIYAPLLLFFSANKDYNPKVKNAERSENLKKSLAETLTHFYPLAGRIKDSVSVDCNDEGIDYLETRVSLQISEITEQPPDLDLLKQFLPCETYSSTWSPLGPEILLAIQVNIFDCGGMAIGACISHRIADAYSLALFVKGWATIACGASEAVSPIFGLTEPLFPPRDLLGFEPSTVMVTKQKIVIKRFAIDASNLAALKAKVADGSGVEHPTRVEAVSALFWKAFQAMARVKGGSIKSYGVVHTVNLRARMDPILPEHSFGNIWWPSTALLTEEEHETGLNGLVGHLRSAIKKISGDYLRKLLVGDGFLKYAKMTSEQMVKGEVGIFNVTSACRFPLYGADFGWGKPIWVCPIGMPFANVVVLTDTKSGDGIEAWVHLLEEDMAIFERDQDLHAFVSSTPIASNSTNRSSSH